MNRKDKRKEKLKLKKQKEKELKEFLKNKYSNTPREILFIYNFLTNRIVFNSFCMTLFLVIMELLLKVIIGSSIIDFSVIRIILSSIIIAIVVNFIFSFFDRKVQRILNSIVMGFFTIYIFIEHILYNMMGFFLGVGNASQGTKIGEYVKDVARSLNITKLSFVFVGILLIVIYVVIDWYISKRRRNLSYTNMQKVFIYFLVLLLIIGLNFVYLGIVKNKNFQSKLQGDSNWSLIIYPENSNLVVNNFGVVVYCLADLVNQVTDIDSNYILSLEKKNIVSNTVDDEVWNKVISNTTNETYNTLNNYFINRDIHEDNSYTGIFKNKNLIIILMESVNDMSILNEKDFPNMYKLYNEGISFRNNYSPRNNCSTGNNEFTVLTGLWTINNVCTANEYSSHTYPEAAFNLFNNSGYNTYAFHDYYDKFYKRNVILPNLGANKYLNAKDMGIEYAKKYTEADDADMYRASSKLFSSNEPFMVYYATVTPHQSYIDPQTCSDRYYDKYIKEGYSSKLSRYLSKLQVFDEGLGVLLDTLKKNGELDDTVIALFADHYPYGLSDKDINEYLVKNNSEYTINRNSSTDHKVDLTPMIIYNTEVKSREIYKYTNIIDLLPTLLNMFDIEYDSRLYLGSDIMSDEHPNRAYFSDKSWVDSVAAYYAPTNKITYSGKKTYTEAEIASINKEIYLKQSISATAIKNNYFEYLFNELKG